MIPIVPQSLAPTGVPAASWCGRPSWSGLLQLSLVGIPLKAYPAVRTRDLPSFHQLHAGCHQRIRYLKNCPSHGPVDANAIVKGYEYGPGHNVVIEPEELDAFRPAQDRALRLERFVEPAQVDPLFFSGRGLYLLPDGPAAESAYAVLHAAMTERGRWALGRLVLGGHRQVALVRPAAAVLVLDVLHYPDQVRACPWSASPRSSGATEELDLAGRLIDAASGPVDWSVYPDQTAQELRALVDAKLEGAPRTPAEPQHGILPLAQALRQSLAATQPPKASASKRQDPAARKRGKRTA